AFRHRCRGARWPRGAGAASACAGGRTTRHEPARVCGLHWCAQRSGAVRTRPAHQAPSGSAARAAWWCPPMHRVTNGRWHWLDRTGFHFADRALVALQRIEETLSFFWLAQFGNNLAKNRCRLNSGRTYIVLVRNSWIIVAEYTARKMGRLAA